MPVVKSNDGNQLARHAFEMLRSAILEGRLPPGTPLSRRRLAEEMGMSAVPVGDAIGRLESEGLVESKPRAGTRVRIATAEEIHGNYVLREALETHSARLFAQSATTAFRKRVLTAAAKLDEAYIALAGNPRHSQSRRARVEREHIAFHMLIAEATAVPKLMNEIERSRVLMFNWLFTVSSQFGSFAPRWHRDLAEVLVHGSAAEAADAMRVHVTFRQPEVIVKFKEFEETHAQQPRMIRGPQRVKI